MAYLVDRRAATLVYRSKSHVESLFVFRAAGPRWPAIALRTFGSARGKVDVSRGFRVAAWRTGDLGYALVSDVSEGDLVALAGKIAGE